MPSASRQHGWRHVRVGQNKLGTATPRARAGRTGRKKTGLASTKKNREPRSDASGARRGVGVLGYRIIFCIQGIE